MNTSTALNSTASMNHMNHFPRHSASWIETASVVAAALLLTGAAIDGTHFRAPPDAKEYQSRVKVATEAFPLNFGNWVGQDVEPDLSAVKLLHPNVMLSRHYVDPIKGGSAGFLFVDCQDARDTVGHYPPICYPSQGWSLQTTTLKDWNLPHSVVHGTEYLFVRGVFDGNGSEYVDNFFVLPGAGIEPNRDEVIKAAGDLQRRFYGVAQIQLVFSGDTTESQRDEAFAELIGPMEDLMKTVETIHADGAAPLAKVGASSAGDRPSIASGGSAVAFVRYLGPSQTNLRENPAREICNDRLE